MAIWHLSEQQINKKLVLFQESHVVWLVLDICIYMNKILVACSTVQCSQCSLIIII